LEQSAPISAFGTFSGFALDDTKTELAQHTHYLGIIIKEALKQEDGAGHSSAMTGLAPGQGTSQ
jgi:hypothetical protein